MGRPKSNVREHFETGEGKTVFCKYCSHKYAVLNVVKMKYHLADRCKDCPLDVKQEFHVQTLEFAGKPKKRAAYSEYHKYDIFEMKLIDLVREHSCIYDFTSDDYKNKELKDYVWGQISEQLDTTAQNAKQEWEKLRDRHRDALKRRARSNKPNSPKIKWKYEHRMKFLLPFIKGAVNIHEEEYYEQEECEFSNNNEDVCTVPDSEADYSFSDSSKSDYVKTEQIFELIKMEPEKPAKSLLKPKHSLDTFFQLVCDTAKNLPRKYQIKVKRDIFETIQRAEEAAAEEEWSSSIQNTNNRYTSNAVENVSQNNYFVR